jgi:hypothetical protein
MRYSLYTLVCVAAIAALHASVAGQEPDKPQATTAPSLEIKEKWVSLSPCLFDEKTLPDTIKLIERSAGAGYNTILLGNGHLADWDLPGNEKKLACLAKVLKACRDNNLRVIVPACLGCLAGDPNLAEGQPVVDAPFIVKDGTLAAFDDGALPIKNGSFEKIGADGLPEGWTVKSGPKAVSLDKEVTFEGKPSLRFRDMSVNGDKNGDSVLHQTVKVKPWRYWHVSMQVKTDGLEGPKELIIDAVGGQPTSRRALCTQGLPIDKTQEWKRVDVIFNTIDSQDIELRLGGWGCGKGTVWFADIKAEPAGLVNLIRREGAPFKMTSEDGQTTYEEGKDIAAVVDPSVGFCNKHPGNYKYWYDQPKPAIPQGSRLKDGQKVFLSYYHAVLVKEYGVFCCLNDPKRIDFYKKNVANMHNLVKPDGYFLCHDEIRCQGWDESCRKSGLTTGQMLAKDFAQCVQAVSKEDPGKPIYVWSDMFDPNHNAARKGYYYLVNDPKPWQGSWEGMDKSVIIVNWHQGDRNSLEWFAGRGQKQILAGYYDAPVSNITPWLKEAATVPGVIGVMYTTWVNDYDKLENWLKTVQAFKP